MKSGDRILLFIVISLIVISSLIYFTNINKAKNKTVVIKSDGKIVKEIPLTTNINKEIIVKSKEGHLTVEIKNDKVRVINSTCKDKLCIKEGWIDRIGESITCLPNRISITIIGNGENKIDTTTY